MMNRRTEKSEQEEDLEWGGSRYGQGGGDQWLLEWNAFERIPNEYPCQFEGIAERKWVSERRTHGCVLSLQDCRCGILVLLTPFLYSYSVIPLIVAYPLLRPRLQPHRILIIIPYARRLEAIPRTPSIPQFGNPKNRLFSNDLEWLSFSDSYVALCQINVKHR